MFLGRNNQLHKFIFSQKRKIWGLPITQPEDKSAVIWRHEKKHHVLGLYKSDLLSKTYDILFKVRQ